MAQCLRGIKKVAQGLGGGKTVFKFLETIFSEKLKIHMYSMSGCYGSTGLNLVF